MSFNWIIKLSHALLFLWGLAVLAQEKDYARSVVNTLASEKYMGRGYTGKADLKAARFITGEFRESGLKSIGKGFFQDFNINVNTFPGAMVVKLDGKELQPGINYLADPASSSLSGKFKVIRVTRQELTGVEILQTLRKLNNDAAVLIDMNDTLKFSKPEEEKIDRLINSIKYSPEFKNPLTIICSDNKLTWSISGWQAKKAAIIVNSKDLDLNKLSEVEVKIKAEFKENYQTQNVIGIIPGTEVPDSFLVITSHYDHLGRMGKKTVFPGANDNASGVAMMLSLSKYFAANPPKYSVLCIAFSGEEAGLLGSVFFTENPSIDLGRIKFLVNFDLAGTGGEGIKVVNGAVFKPEFEKLQKINEQYGLLTSVQSRGEACISDHCMFYKLKVPCFYIYTLGGISAYHDIYDRPETLPLTEFQDYSSLMTIFLSSL